MISKTTAGMPPAEKVNTMAHVMGSSGNLNIRGHHLKYFEDQILNLNENKEKDVTSAPNYVAWLFLMADYIFWTMRSVCYRYSDFNHDLFDFNYNKLIEAFFETCEQLGKCDQDEKKPFAEKILSILDLRHSLIHKGYPNLLPATLKKPRKKPSLGTKASAFFDKKYTRQNMKYYSDPRNFERINAEFKNVVSFILKGPGVAIGF